MDILTVTQLLQEVRDQSDEENTATRDDAAIIRILNRGQKIAASVLARYYPEVLHDYVDLQLISGQSVYDGPDNAFENRLEYIEIRVPGYPVETRKRGYRDSTRLAVPATAPIPWSWMQRGNKVEFLQAPSGAYPARLWFVKRPERLTKDQGRVTVVDSAGSYVIVDSAGNDLTTQVDDLKNFVNVVSFRDGKVLGTFQVQSIIAGKITFKAVPTRSTVQGRPVSSVITPAMGIEPDDYVCLAEGTCIPFFQDAIYGYCMQYAVAELARSLHSNMTTLEAQVKMEADRLVKSEWSGRELTDRVKNRSQAWPTFYRRWPIQGPG